LFSLLRSCSPDASFLLLCMLFKRDIKYLFSLLPAIATLYGNTMGGMYAWFNFVLSLIVLAIAELLLGKDIRNEHSPTNAILPEAILYIHVLAHGCVLYTFFSGINSGLLSGAALVGAVLSTAVEAGSGAIIVAHDLIHKASPVKQFFGRLLLFSCGNFYFFIHHLRVHHRFVATEEDAATAKRGESLYVFVLRTVKGQISESFQSESQRLTKLNKSAWTLSNLLLRDTLTVLLIFLVLVFTLSLTAALCWFAACVFSNFLLEYINYIEHYGLTRDPKERVNHGHSWNCDTWISRYLLIDLSRHADHHHVASRPYYQLQSFPHSPRLPGGYASLILPALIPRWWFSLMHPRLDSLKK